MAMNLLLCHPRSTPFVVYESRSTSRVLFLYEYYMYIFNTNKIYTLTFRGTKTDMPSKIFRRSALCQIFDCLSSQPHRLFHFSTLLVDVHKIFQ